MSGMPLTAAVLLAVVMVVMRAVTRLQAKEITGSKPSQQEQ